jgi:CBS domain-containing protein
MKVEDVMTPLVESAHPDDTLRDAAEKMKALDLDPLPVTEGRKIIGCITHDEVNRVAAERGLGAGSTRVSEIMKPEVTCIRSDRDVDAAIQELGDQPDARVFSRFPVVNAQGQLVGSVTVDSLRKRLEQEAPDEGVAAVFGVESISNLVNFDEDRVDYMSDESFPASDPIPPPSALGPEDR